MKTPMVIVSLVILSLTTIGTASACSALGENKHLGTVLSVDEAKNSFMLLDAESSMPISFVADAIVIAKAKAAEGRVVVDYQIDGAQLRALDVMP